MRTPCSDLWMPERIFMKLGIYILEPNCKLADPYHEKYNY
jgi:hypothetical protein